MMSHPHQGGSPRSRVLHVRLRISASLVLLLVLSLLLTSCDLFRRPATVTPSEPSPTPGRTTVASPAATTAGGQASQTGQPQGKQPGLAAAREVRGMAFYLSEGSAKPPQEERIPVAQGQPLGEGEIESLLERLPALEGQGEDVQPFRLPAQSPPAPRPGQTITQTFPPPDTGPAPEQATAGPLTVLRYSPEGEVPLAPYLSVTFDQPMAPLATHEQLAAGDVPVMLQPLPQGQWRWVGTKTLMFEPAGRFPMATEYRAEIAAGATSVTGGKLAETVAWSFTTPPPQVQRSYPSDGVFGREPLFFISFDQGIDPAAVLQTIMVRAGGETLATRLATPEEVRGDAFVSRLAKEAVEGRWLAFRLAQLLPYDARVQVDVGPGTPSAEGPRTTTAAQSFSFSTYGPLRVVEHRCGWDNKCPPMAPWTVEFSNPLDMDAFDPSQVTIDPELPAAEIYAAGSSVQIRGRSRGRTTYKVTLKSGILDDFGQTLERDETVTFAVGSAEAAMVTPWQPLVVLDPSTAPQYTVYTINYDALRVQAYAVQPADWPAYERYLRERPPQGDPGTPPGQRVLDRKVPVKGERDAMAETVIDLSPVLKDGRGHLILIIYPEAGLLASRPARDIPVIRAWVQATAIALDAFVDQEEALVWANALQDGASLSGVDLALFPGNTTARTDDQGMARLKLGTPQQEEGHYLQARRGDDIAILPAQAYGWGGGWRRRPLNNAYRWYVFDDRQIYRPGEDVHIKGWIRLAELARGRESLTLPGSGMRVRYELQDSRGNPLLNGEAPLNLLGGFHAVFTLPETTNLGPASLTFRLSRPSANTEYIEWWHQIQVQQFRRPEFEVSASASEGPHLVGGHAITTVSAQYYAGGPLPNAEVTWEVTSQPGSYRPPKWDDYEFGIWTPWWGRPVMRGGSRISVAADYYPGEAEVKSFSGRTDASGTHSLRIDFEAGDPPKPMSVQAQATVMDVNRQAWTASSQLLVHPSELYVGLRGGPMFVEQGKPLPVDAIVTDLDGQAIANRSVELKAVRLVWTYVKGEWQEQERDEQVCTIVSASEPQRCTFQTPEGGTYRVSATVYDDLERPNLTQITRWVGGGQWPRANRVEQEEVRLIPDRQEYQPGDTAEILVQSPFAPAEGLLTLRINGLAHSERFRMESSSTVLRVAIDEDSIPNVNVQVDLVGGAPRLNSAGEPDDRLPQRPAYASGALDLGVPPYLRTLSLTVTPRDLELEPGAETTVDVQVRDAAGQAVAGAELAVAVVDESVLALTGYQLADPLSAFYPSRAGGVSDHHLREQVLLVDPDTLLEQAAAAPKMAGAPSMVQATAVMEREEAAMDMAAGRRADAASQPIRVRTDFNPLAAFEPAVPTDADGTASVQIKLPDNLTRYRVMVLAVADAKLFGKGDASITARLPLMVRPSPPRFLNFGDRFELPVVLQNQTDSPLQADIALRVTNLSLVGGAGQRITIPPRDRVEARFPATALSAGIARLQVAASAGQWADAAQLELPVYTPATTEAFAVYGAIDQGAIAQPLIAPTDVYTQFGGLEITTSSTALQALSDAVLYLTSYPYECSEQLASRVLAIAALRDVLSAFNAAGLPPADELELAVQRDIETLGRLQNDDGGFPVWWRGDESWPFHTIHVAHALARAQQKDFAVPEEMISRALVYLREVESRYPQWYDRDMRNTLTAYALSVRARLGDPDPARARQLVRDVGVENLKMEALGWLLPILANDAASSAEVGEIRRFLANRVTETAGAANFVTSYREEDAYVLLSSNRRADGILLEAFIDTDPKNDLIPKLVTGLLAHRKQWRWGNTQENVFILLALDRYFQEYEAQTPDLVARAWLGEQYVGSFTFQGRSTDYQQVQVPMSYLAQIQDQQDLVLDKQGQGRLYYRLGLRYAPTDPDLPPMDQGFAVERAYEWVDDPADVRQDADGVWHVRAGARVRVRLTMVAPSRRYHVALIDPLPAGLEILNPALAVTGSLPRDPSGSGAPRYWWWHWTWYEHQNLRDERAEAFASLLWDGIHTYTYVTRATTPGQFVAPPARAEEMYSPEVFGRSGTDRVMVE